MAARLRWQIVRDAVNRWMIWRLDDAAMVNGELGVEHEQIARVVNDDGRFFVEEPVWGADGIERWNRLPRGWLTKAGATHSVLNPKKALAS